MARATSIFLLALALTLYFVQVNTSGCHPPCPKNNVITADLTDPAVVAEYNLNLIDTLWNSTYPTLTKKGLRFKNILLKLAHSDVPLWRLTASTASLWIWSFLPQYSVKPDFSAFAKIISTTVLDRNDCHYCEKLNSSVNAIVENANQGTSYTIATSLKNAGCCYKKPKMVKSDYTAKNSIDDAKKLWKQVGCSYPCEFQRAVLCLYKSCKYIDQLLAVVATASLSNHLTNLGANFNVAAYFQMYQMQLIDKVPKHCCRSLKQDLEESSSSTTDSTAKEALYVLKQAGC